MIKSDGSFFLSFLIKASLLVNILSIFYLTSLANFVLSVNELLPSYALSRSVEKENSPAYDT